MAPRKPTTPEPAPLFRILPADEKIATVTRKARDASKTTAASNAMLTEIVSAMTKLSSGRKVTVPVSSFTSVRGKKGGTEQDKAKAARSFVNRWAEKNGEPFTEVVYTSDWSSLVLVK